MAASKAGGRGPATAAAAAAALRPTAALFVRHRSGKKRHPATALRDIRPLQIRHFHSTQKKEMLPIIAGALAVAAVATGLRYLVRAGEENTSRRASAQDGVGLGWKERAGVGVYLVSFGDSLSLYFLQSEAPLVLARAVKKSFLLIAWEHCRAERQLTESLDRPCRHTQLPRKKAPPHPVILWTSFCNFLFLSALGKRMQEMEAEEKAKGGARGGGGGGGGGKGARVCRTQHAVQLSDVSLYSDGVSPSRLHLTDRMIDFQNYWRQKSRHNRYRCRVVYFIVGIFLLFTAVTVRVCVVCAVLLPHCTFNCWDILVFLCGYRRVTLCVRL